MCGGCKACHCAEPCLWEVSAAAQSSEFARVGSMSLRSRGQMAPLAATGS
jgi:hypothetical protein